MLHLGVSGEEGKARSEGRREGATEGERVRDLWTGGRGREGNRAGREGTKGHFRDRY